MDVLGGEGVARGRFGRYLATDGSLGERVAVDVGRPHAGVVVGKRGSGKSYTLGVLAEELADAPGVAPVVVDPMGVFGGLADAGLSVTASWVRARSLAPRAWCEVLDLDPASSAGTLVWRAADEAATLDGMQSWVDGVRSPNDGKRSPDAGVQAEEKERSRADGPDAAAAAVRAAANHLALASSWDCFSPDAPDVAALLDDGAVLDCTRLAGSALRAVVHAVASSLYRAVVEERVDCLPWLLVDEAHACASGIAESAVETLYTRGRAPGASVVLATQRPSALPEVAVSQSDLLVSHRLTSGMDVDALAATRPTYLSGDVADRLPTRTGDALVVDDATETACTIRVRERRTTHDGGSARATPDVADRE